MVSLLSVPIFDVGTHFFSTIPLKQLTTDRKQLYELTVHLQYKVSTRSTILNMEC